jgi:pyruvate dehydrogenase E2 component (dihydrolipoamide acetyltransferase)
MTILTALTIPKWGLAMEEGTVIDWRVPVGSIVTAGLDVVDIESSKIANVLEAPVSGTLVRIVADAGTVLPVGAIIGVLAEGAATDSEIDAFVADYQSRFAVEAAAVESGPREPQMVDINGVSLAYDSWNPEAPSKLLLIHGFSGDRNNWLFNVEALAADHHVIAVDLPGHGRSTKNVGDGSIETLASHVLGFLDALGLSSVSIVAHSMGAAVALRMAQINAAAIRKIATLGGFGMGSDANPEFVTGMLDAERRKDMSSVLEMLFANPDLVTRDLTDAMLAYKRTDGVQESLGLLGQNALSPKSGQMISASLSTVTQPVLAIWGSDDRIVPCPASVPEIVQLEKLSGIGHMPHMEAASDVNRLLIGFLKNR